ncbi:MULTISPECIES: alpha/beta fold hydrolase [unclassified Mesorhizobium]|uniref:alpha/beta fold hydrolase n=1 Tax=unclassified Mesorhizobium TaxID=325217 RepID=UPI000FC998A0|nr:MULTISPECIES: alpha/beta fold hydrolase [unclassified Mesorhizobium]TGP26399.1 alpha/beta fold hydrolase [Mesorhizobium sp. M1D.F.Ca.ET.231.01.1.1]TGP38357.1 alpha/beta fold hydrolase [Mesorhizobium sp. M1D.F.Ca.ET.234.01.1.1]TGS50567.1 alpha/beta fold hydrolase [Mesorhizobium sp. M1D.F.Ca.ET.184.01.1.1]TGS66452.1 alpha/beta fold hydrolase [Mesorhizobium sp. M1D.F.Ca.ET.183.01.1.1]
MLISVLSWLVGGLLVAAIVAVLGFMLATWRIAARAERLVPACGKFVEIDGNRIHYVEEGEGRPIIFLHGLGAQLHHFRQTLFGRFGAGYRLIALDRPGSGYSVRAGGASGRLPEQAEVVRRFIEQLGLERPLVVGHSLGGAVALALAIEHPTAISGIALLAPLTHLEVRARQKFDLLYVPSRLWRRVLARTVAIPVSLKYAEPTMKFIFSPQAVPGDYMIVGGGWLGLRPAHFHATSTDFVAVEEDLGRLEQRYGEIVMPAGILFGADDRVIGIAAHGDPMPGRIKQLDFERVQGLGHMPQFVEPERVVAFIQRVAERAFAGIT